MDKPPRTGLVFVTKIKPDGTSPVFTTYYSAINATGVAVDRDGNILFSGNSARGYGRPLVNSIRPEPASNPSESLSYGFVAKLNKSGDVILYSSFLGGTWYSTANAIAVDPQGCAYITGDTSDTDFPLINPLPEFETISGPLRERDTGPEGRLVSANREAYVMKLRPMGGLELHLLSTSFRETLVLLRPNILVHPRLTILTGVTNPLGPSPYIKRGMRMSPALRPPSISH